ncbi:MAG: hypothetical protein QXO51_02970 [Halobacteria archaeon]
MGLFRRRNAPAYEEEEDRVEFRTDLPMKLRFLWIDLKHAVLSRRPFRTLRVRWKEWRESRAERREMERPRRGRGAERP